MDGHEIILRYQRNVKNDNKGDSRWAKMKESYPDWHEEFVLGLTVPGTPSIGAIGVKVQDWHCQRMGF